MKKIYLILFLVSFYVGGHANIVEPIGDGTIKVARFYPNPANSQITFEFKNLEKSYSIQVYNFLGKRLFSQTISSSKVSIPLESFYRGLYIYQLRDATGGIIESGKFQIIR